jgi:hypothetical protein
MEGLGTEGVGEMDAQGWAAHGEMDNLAESGVAEVVGDLGVLRLGDLLGSGPGAYPILRDRGLGRELARRGERQQKSRDETSGDFHET